MVMMYALSRAAARARGGARCLRTVFRAGCGGGTGGGGREEEGAHQAFEATHEPQPRS